MAAAMALALATICFWCSLKDGSMASFKHTAFAAMVCTSGPPCVPGKVSRSSSLAKAALQSTKPARGPRRVLCVVVETMSACGTGLGCSPAATSPAMCAISTKMIVAGASAYSRMIDFGDALKIDHPRIGTCPGDDHFRLVLVGQPLDFVVVDALVFFAHAVGHEFVHTAGKVQRMSVGQVTTMRKVHAQHGVPRLERGHVDGHVCGSTRMGLHVGVFRAKQFFGAVDGQLLDLVGELAAAVITLSRIALRI